MNKLTANAWGSCFYFWKCRLVCANYKLTDIHLIDLSLKMIFLEGSKGESPAALWQVRLES